MTRRPIPAAFAVPVLALTLAAVPSVAAAGSAPTPSAAATEVASRHTADVVGDTTGFRAPARVPAGVTHFRVSTSNPAGIRLGIFRLNDGVRLDTFVEHLRLALTGRGEEALAAGQAMAREAVLHGGVMTIPGRTATVSPVLMPGRYYLVDYLTVESATPVVRPLDVFGSDTPAQLAAVHAAVTIRDTPDGPRYSVPDRLRAGTVLRVSNHSRNLNEAVMMELRPGADAADVQRFFEIVDSGSWPTETPFARSLRPDGVPALSPGRSIAVEPALTPGRYAVVTWFPDEHGRMHAARGAFALFTVTPASGASQTGATQHHDRAAIESLWQRQAEAWGRGDGAAYAATYTERLDAIIFNGDHLATRREFGDYMQRAFDTALKGTRLSSGEVKSFRFLSPNEAIAVTTGCVVRAGQTSCVPDSIQTHVAVKRHGTWLLTTFQNTRIAP